MDGITFNPRKAAEAQSAYCERVGVPQFAPYSGNCWRCGKSIYTLHTWPDNHTTGISVETASTRLITGCPHCNISYCE